MSYQPLARKYRPAGFEDLIGQDSVAKALGNGIRLGREPHAVIFSGVRGIGKTTIARLYAKALNCENGPTPNPCGECQSCLAIAKGTHEDVLEIDGASNTSVDDVRQLRETVDYVPQRSRYKVYIIDEVHMLSNSAFNALLKTLEEPPPHVVFLFATTELQKIPQTIIGRCQTFYLRKFSTEQVADRIRHILRAESILSDDRTIHEIAKRGNGSMRDALTFLDTAIAVSGGELTLAKISGLLNSVSTQSVLDLLRAMLEKDSTKGITIIDQLDQQGVEFDDLIEQLVEFSRHAFLLRDLDAESNFAHLTGLDTELISQLRSISDIAKPLDLNQIFRSLVSCLDQLDGSNLDRYVVENYFFEWCLDPGISNLDKMTETLKIPTATSVVESKRDLRQALLDKANEPIKKVIESKIAAPVQTKSHSPEFPETWRALVDAWQRKKPLQARIFEETYSITYGPELISIGVNQNSLAGMKLLNREVQIKVTQQMNELFGFTGQFNVVNRQAAESGVAGSSTGMQQRESLLDTKLREKDSLREKIRQELSTNPTTQSVLEIFGGHIESIEVIDPT